MNIYEKPNQSKVTHLKDRRMIKNRFSSGYVMKSPIHPTISGGTLQLDFTQLGFNIGQKRDVVELTNFLYGLMQGMTCTNHPEWLEYFLHSVGDQLEIGRGKREDLDFLHLMWSDKEPREIKFKDDK